MAELYGENPSTSAKRASNELAISNTSTRRVIKQLKLRVYIPRLVQHLHEDDFDRRKEFCETMIENFQNDIGLVDRIIWSDEATFKLDGSVNRHNSVYYATQNPHLIQTKEVASLGLCVWAAIHSGGIFGPFFFAGTVNGQCYLEMLQQQFIPALETLPNHDEYLFQQDGAPPHYANVVRDWLNSRFDGQWIGRRGSFCDWPARSPDLTVCDFFLWGYIKDRVYKTRSVNLAELCKRITNEFSLVDADLCRQACQSVLRRFDACLRANGEHFEHLD